MAIETPSTMLTSGRNDRIGIGTIRNCALRPRATHQLDTMIRGLPTENAFKSELSWLEAYATAFRYPRTKGGINDAPPNDKLMTALTKTTIILKQVADHFGVVDLDIAAKSPAARSQPPRKNENDGGDGSGGSISGGP